MANTSENAPKVEESELDDLIASEVYFTADNITNSHTKYAEGIGWKTKEYNQIQTSLSLITICILVLKNGFSIVGTSACVSPENFKQDEGRKYAREKAFEQLWQLEG